ncbi:hypothetical protein NXS08_00135 [Gleimia sp. 6138-11-ORH1]|uniref:hypothetical protein n=1 Tax=Gleimia sp. 6138-11-ORH1 TaxID=2973937 RepID=UPI002168C5AA|nr:hypothetical protein [Gleimia sp. 6138-11-ORH1]MCS4483902.1 hypothetical protein [Gleimia sp. 6138-11-ORH1]
MLQLRPFTEISVTGKSAVSLENAGRFLHLPHISYGEIELLKLLQAPLQIEVFQALAVNLGVGAEASHNLLQILQKHDFLCQFSADFYDAKTTVTDPVIPSALEILIAVPNLSAQIRTSPDVDFAYQSLTERLFPFISTLIDLLLVAPLNSVKFTYEGDYPVAELPEKLQAVYTTNRLSSVEVPDLLLHICADLPDLNAMLAAQSAGVPFLPVVLTEDSMQIGPLVKPAGAPCLKCLELFYRRNFPQQFAASVASQQKGFPFLAPPLLVAGAAHVALACEHLSKAQSLLPGEVRYLDEDLLLERTLWPFNPECDNHLPALPSVS